MRCWHAKEYPMGRTLEDPGERKYTSRLREKSHGSAIASRDHRRPQFSMLTN